MGGPGSATESKDVSSFSAGNKESDVDKLSLASTVHCKRRSDDGMGWWTDKKDGWTEALTAHRVRVRERGNVRVNKFRPCAIDIVY